VYVKAVAQDGTVLVDKTVQTMANGFFELWLPRNKTIDLTIQGFNKTATGVISTFSNSKTCLTTFHLQ
jgi:hypothetical protein